MSTIRRSPRVSSSTARPAPARTFRSLSPARQRTLAGRFAGDFLEGLEVPDSPAFGGWLTAQRRRFRGCQAALLEQLALDAGDAASADDLEQWLRLAPLDRRAHEAMLVRLARCGRHRDGEAHLAATAALFEAEGLDAMPLRARWRQALGQQRGSAASVITASSAAVPERAPARRAAIAVMPFADLSTQPRAGGGIADALAYDVTARLARLRNLLVIAQGSMQALHARQIGVEEAGRMLDVDYVVGGRVRLNGSRLSVEVELIETRSARLLWSELLEQPFDETLAVLDEIGNRVVVAGRPD